MSVIVTRAPLRVSFGGGGTDLPSYYREHGGFVVSAGIDRYVYMLTATAFRERFTLKHLEWEDVDEASEVRHPILRAALERHWDGRPLEIASVADAPPGTGLGSSGSYAVCTLKALALASGENPSAGELAERACEIEIEVLERTVGKQDQYVAAHGGVRAYEFAPDGSVAVRALNPPPGLLEQLSERLLLVYTGGVRSAAGVLAGQVERTLAGDREVQENLHRTKALARESCTALEAGDLDGLAEVMNAQWETKLARIPAVATPRVLELRELALQSGALGAMLMGAGGGGFLLVHARETGPVCERLAAAGAPALRLGFDADGCVALARP